MKNKCPAKEIFTTDCRSPSSGAATDSGMNLVAPIGFHCSCVAKVNGGVDSCRSGMKGGMPSWRRRKKRMKKTLCLGWKLMFCLVAQMKKLFCVHEHVVKISVESIRAFGGSFINALGEVEVRLLPPASRTF
jgi:hypothetical protein